MLYTLGKGERRHSGSEEARVTRDESNIEIEGFSNLWNLLERQLKEGKLEVIGSAVLGLDRFGTLRLGFSGFDGRREMTHSYLRMKSLNRF